MSRRYVSTCGRCSDIIASQMPKLWNNTIEGHRSAVAEAIMDKTAVLAAAEGLHSLTMARIAQEVGIGRATLYKYFNDVEQILTHWHQRQIETHLRALEEARASASSPLAALKAVLIAYGQNTSHGHDETFVSLLHAMPHVRHAHQHLTGLIAALIADAVKSGEIKGGASADELAHFALAAIAASTQATSKPALHRLVGLILRGLGASGGGAG